jgi:threonylcarbamoyladenosine tRNA methylthiotransferase MtaB
MASGEKRNRVMDRKCVAIATLGCKVNQFDSEVIRKDMERLGLREVPFFQRADVYIVNTCTVTGRSDYQSRQLIRRAHRLNPEALILATGCYAEVFPHAVNGVKGVSAILGNRAKREMASAICDLMKGRKPLLRVPPVMRGPLENSVVDGFSGHARAFLKIQDGCDAACSYCIVPRARGSCRSLAPEKALKQLVRLKARGFEEVVLTGVHLGSYGQDLSPSISLAGFLEQIEKRPNLPARIRLSSVEPTDFGEPLLSVIGNSKRICPHVHIPLQSGDNQILARMNREYTREAFRALILDLTQRVPSVCIGLDVIGGFPGEEEPHFQNTVDLITDLPVAYLHVFPFSPRPGTIAFDLPRKIGGDEIRKRCSILRDLGQKKRTVFYERFLHQRMGVLEEKTTVDEAGRRKSVSRNYIPVWVEPEDRSPNGEIEVEITEVRGQKVLGRRI